MKKVFIDGVAYVPETEAMAVKAEELDGMPYCIVRTYSAGVFAGYIESRDGKEVRMVQARRIWYWDGANSLSDLATIGTTKPENCKFCAPITVTLTEVIEIDEVTEQAKKSIEEVAVWTKRK